MKTLLIILAFLSVLSVNTYSQVSEEWVKRFSGTGAQDDAGNDITTDASGNVYVTGTIYGLFGDANYYTIKYDAAGTQAWAKSYDAALQDDYGRVVKVDASGNVYVTGSSRATDSTGNRITTIKYNSAGTQQWINHTNVGNEVPMDMTLDAAGNVYVTGYLLYHPYGRVVTVKYNSAGTQQWLAQYYPSNTVYYEGACVEVDASGNVYVGGYFGATLSGSIHLIKYNSAGTQQWVRTYSGGGNVGVGDIVYDMTSDAAGNIYMTGTAKGMSGSNGPDMVTLKYNSAGTLQWAQKYNNANNNTDIANCIAVDGLGNVYVGGLSNPNSNGNSDIALVKYNSSGTQQWVRVVNGQGNGGDVLNDMVLDAAGNIFVVGNSTGLGTFNNYITMRYNPSGTQIWSQTYLGPGNEHDYGYAIALGLNGAVYVTGRSEGSSTAGDIATIKYGQTVGVQNVNTEVPERFSLGQNYPNPFNPVTNIKFDIANASNVKLTVFDIAGREIAQLVNQQLNAGTYNVDFDASHLASGTYFYRIDAGSFTEIKKMVLIK